MRLITEMLKFPIERSIQSIVKVSEEDYEIIKQELEEYIVTEKLEKEFNRIFELLLNAKNITTQDIGIWISGFFGSGKSLFLKILAYILSNKKIGNKTALEIFLPKLENSMTKANLSTITSSIKIIDVLFEIKSQENQMNPDSITEILYRQFNKKFGYSEIVWIAELEKELEKDNKYEEFKNLIKKETGKEWEELRNQVLRLKPTLYKTLPKIYPELYENEEKVKETLEGFEKINLTPEKFAQKVKEYIDANFEKDQILLFFIDEVGMFVLDNSKKLQELQIIVEQLGEKCKGKTWVAVTAQEKLDEVIDRVRLKKLEFAKISDRFHTKIVLTSENIDQVVKERLLKKNEKGAEELKKIFKNKEGKLKNDINLKDWARSETITPIDEKNFIESYPFLPYQINITPDIFNGIRNKGGGFSKLSGRERSMLGAIHKIFNDENINFKDKKIGSLVTLDMIYDQAATELSGDTIRNINQTAKLAEKEEDGEFIKKVAKTVFLMGHIGYVPRTTTNIAMMIYPHIDIEFKELKETTEKALNKLTEAQYVIKDHTGWKFLSAEEKKIEEEIQSTNIKPYEKQQSTRSILTPIFDIAKIPYKGIPFDVKLVLDGEQRNQKGGVELRIISSINLQLEEKTIEQIESESIDNAETIFWVADEIPGLNDKIDKFEKIRQVLEKKKQQNEVLSEEDRAILREKENQKNSLQEEITHEIKKSFYEGTIINESITKKLDGRKEDIKGITTEEVEKIIPKVFHKFQMGSEKATEADILSIFEKNLSNTTQVYKNLGLINNNNQINPNANIAQEILKTIKDKTNFGQSTLGKDLEDYFSRKPYGWPKIILRIVLATIFRNGTIIAVYQQKVHQDYTETAAKDLFKSSPNFRNTKFEEAGQGDLTPEQRQKCRELIDKIYDERIPDSPNKIKETIIAKMIETETKLEKIQGIITSYGMTTVEFSELKQAITKIKNQTIPQKIIQAFLEKEEELKKYTSKLLKIYDFSTEQHLKEYPRIKTFTEQILPRTNPEQHKEIQQKLQSEEFIDSWPEIRTTFERLFKEYKKEYDQAIVERTKAFEKILKELKENPIIKQLTKEHKKRILEPLENKKTTEKLPENTTTFTINTETLQQIKENIQSTTSFKQQTVQQALKILQEEQKKKEAEKIEYINLIDITSGQQINNEKELNVILEKIKTKIQKSLKKGKRIILG